MPQSALHPAQYGPERNAWRTFRSFLFSEEALFAVGHHPSFLRLRPRKAPLVRHRFITPSLRQFPRSRSQVAVCSLLPVILFALTFATPASAAPDANARCISAAAQAGLLGPDRNPGNTNFVSGTDGDESFEDRSTAGQDVFCGFGGNDSVYILDTGDVFLGGEGNDSVSLVRGSTFLGGEGNDSVYQMVGGTFNGGAGDDDLVFLFDGTFDGGEGDDSAFILRGGTFNGEEGSDSVTFPQGGTFNQD